MIPIAFPVCINDSLGSSRPWPVLNVCVQHGRRSLPRVRCSISLPGRRPVSSSTPGSSSAVWSGLVTKHFRAAVASWNSYLEHHKAWSEMSLQTLQRVGTLIRSTSNNCIAALNTSKKAAPQPPSPGQSPDDEEDAAAQQLRASLSRFITTASKAEVSQAALLSDLSNMAYDVEAISHQQLQQQHHLTMVAHSRAGQLPAAAGAATEDSARSGQQGLPEPVYFVLPTSSQQQQQVLYRPAESAAHSPAAAAAAPAWDAAPTYTPSHMLNGGSSNGSYAGLASPPMSPRTPFVLSSFSEAEDLLAAADVPQMATASAVVSSPGTPRRLTSAQSTGGSDSSSRAATVAAAAPAAAVDAPVMLQSSGGSAGAALASQLMQYQQQDMEATAARLQQQHQQSASLTEQQALLELQQQEQQVLQEMQQHQQLQLLLQQEQAIMQQLQEHASGSVGSSSAAGSSSSSSAVSWWMQQLQQRVAATSDPAPTASSSSSSATATVEQGSPADWFVCDGPGLAAAAAGGSDSAAAAADAAVPTRYFVIQGSISLNHWVINLSIDPVDFENGALGGIKVHRGVYEAALEMLDSFVPFVKEHLAKHPDGKIAFTGHSLGGSLATLLMLLLVHRGILPAGNVATVRTFGAPAIFCEGATGSPPSAGFCQSCSLPCQHREERLAASAAAGAAAAAAGGAAAAGRPGHPAGGLLGRLGLAPETVVNVIMCRDIVPRAFVCDYTLVADVLKSWLPSFKEHVGLAACRDHKALYNFLGTVEVLQPSVDCPFMLPDETHSMLPQQPALYKLTEPCCNLPTPSAANPTTPAAAAAPAGPCSCSGACSGSCSGCAAAGSCSSKASKKKSSSKLGTFGSFGSLANLGSSLSLTSAIAELTSAFTLVSGNSGSIVSVPVQASEVAAAAAAASNVAAAAAAEPLPAGAESPASASEEQQLPAAGLALAAEVPAAVAAADPLGLTLGDAILTFMNSPHPLETLKEMRAYGPAGSISRFHNPNSYTQALQQLSGASK